MQRFFVVLLIGISVLGGLVRSQTTVLELYFQMAVLGTVAAFAVLMLVFSSSWLRGGHTRLPPLARSALLIWGGAAIVAGYGMALSIEGGWSTQVAMALAVRFTPFLLVPVFAYALRDDLQWRRALWFFIVVGTVSAFVDLSAVDVRDVGRTRLVSGDFYGAYHQYALLFCVLVLSFGPTKGWSRWSLLALAPVLLWRTMLSLSRGPVALVVFGLIYSIALSTRFQVVPLLRRVMITAVVLLVVWSPLQQLSQTRLADTYQVAFLARAAYTGTAVQYRIAELRSAFVYGGLAGQGWGSTGDFSSALNYTNSAEAVATKSYVHNLLGFAWWKLGVLGGGLVLSFAVFAYTRVKRSLAEDDRLGMIMGGVLLLWLVHSMVNMDFVRAELNLIIAACLGYFLSKSTWGGAVQPQGESGTARLLRRSPRGESAPHGAPIGVGMPVDRSRS